MMVEADMLELKMTDTAREARIQREQLGRYLSWIEEEGGLEGPVRLDTYMQPHQQDRIGWLRRHATGRILEAGCSWGYVLAAVGGHVGVDVNPANVALARILDPGREFHAGSVLSLGFLEGRFDTVLLPEVLEHIPFDDVELALNEARKVCANKVLITVPVNEELASMKHVWTATPARIEDLKGLLKNPSIVFENEYFLHIEERV